MRIDSQVAGNGYSSNQVEPVKAGGPVRSFSAAKDYAPGPEEKAPAEKDDFASIESAAKYIDKALKMVNSHLEFKFHEESGRYHVRIVDDESSQVIREIPPKSVLKISAMIKKKLDEMMGFLVDELA